MSTNYTTDCKKSSSFFNAHPFVMVGMILLALIVLFFSLMVSIAVGAADINVATVWEALVHYDADSINHQIIWDLRMPRALAGALVGMGLAIAGSMLQGMTRNPLASPSIMGVNAGSGFALALCMAFVPGLAYTQMIMVSFLGAALGVGIVYGVGAMARGGLTPVRLALAGIAVSTLLSSLSSGLSIYYQTGQDLTYWFAGGFTTVEWVHIQILLFWMTIGFVGSLILSRSITVLSLGEDTTVSLGQRVALVKVVGIVMVLLLAGSVVSIAGPIGFIGLIIPHITRFIVGMDYRWLIPSSAVLGGLFVVLADIVCRVVNPPYEIPLGVITAIVGVPFFLLLARRDGKGL